MNSDMKVANMTVAQLLEGFKQLIDESDFVRKSDIEILHDEISALWEMNHELKERVKELETKNSKLEKKLDALDNTQRRNNLIFRGLDHTASSSPKESIASVCQTHLKLDEETVKSNLLEAKLMGPKNCKDRPIIATFKSAEMVNILLRNTSNLKGTTYSVLRDLSEKKREQRKSLLTLRKDLMMDNCPYRISVNTDKLKIGTKEFRLTDTNVIEGEDVETALLLTELLSEIRRDPNATPSKTRAKQWGKIRSAWKNTEVLKN